MTAPVRLTWAQARQWRLHRHWIDPAAGGDAVQVAGRLCGVQAQVPSAAELAVAVRIPPGRPTGLGPALADGRLMRTWTVRGTLHVLPPPAAARQLSLLAAARSWHKGSWQREFAALAVMEALADHVAAALNDGPPLTRDELVAAVEDRIGPGDLGQRLRSGWSVLLKPLAWQGLLCQGPLRGRNVTFARPDRVLPGWPGLPDPADAGPAVVRDYLTAFGPATIEAFDAWLLRGATPKAAVRRWFAALGDETVDVDVEGRPALVLRGDLDEIRAMRPSRRGDVHLLPAFDQYVMGPGTNDPAVVPPEHRPLVSRAGGWISPVVLLGGRAAGTWEPEGGIPRVYPFPGVDLPRRLLSSAVDRMAALLSRAAS